jgi:hypothetical protein
MARRAVAGEVINSLKGRQTVAAGGWVIRGPENGCSAATSSPATNQRPEPVQQSLEIAEQSRHQRLGLAEGKQVTARQLFGL